MGCGQSSGLEAERSRQISRELRKDFSRESQFVKLLLLGAGESGKSTIVKQMKLLHPVNERSEIGFNAEERGEAKRAIYDNILDSMVALLEAASSMGLDSNKLQEDREKVERFVSIHSSGGTRPDQETTKAIKTLWSNSIIQNCYQRRSEFQLNDSAGYFLSDIDRICKEDFAPTDQDILRTRVITTGIVKIEFEFRKMVFHMFDVGGQRSERKKWIHCFDNVTAVLFIISLSEYDQVLFEDRSTNRMHESLNLFASVVNNVHFKMKPFIVFFNKKDLFEEKLKSRSIRTAFPDFAGNVCDVQQNADFIINKYLSQSSTSSRQRPIYPHLTTATDTKLVDRVFTSVAEIILNDILKDIGLN